jgi:hypothetical protein
MLTLNGLGSKEQAVYKPQLVGKWLGDAENKFWTFEQDKDLPQAYILTITPNEARKGMSIFHVMLFEIDGKLYLDMMPHESVLEEKEPKTRGDLYNWCLLFGHMIAQVAQVEPTLKLAFLSPDLGDKLTAEQLNKIEIQKFHDRNVITSPTQQLRAFISSVSDEEKAWGGWSEMKRAQ